MRTWSEPGDRFPGRRSRGRLVAGPADLRRADARPAAARRRQHRRVLSPRLMKQTGPGHRRGRPAGRSHERAARAAPRSREPRPRRSRPVRRRRRSWTTVAAVCPDVIVNCAAYTERRRRRAEPDGGAGGQRVGASGRWRARPPRSTRCSCTSARTSSSTATPSRPYTEDDRPNPRGAYAVSKLLGEWFAADVPTHYVLARREPVRRSARARAAWTRSCRTCRPAAKCAPSRIAPSRPATSTTSSRPRAPCSSDRARRASITASTPAGRPGRARARAGRDHRQAGRPDRRRLDGRRRPGGAAAEVRGPVERQADCRRHRRCRRGNPRSGATWPRLRQVRQIS